VEYEYELLDMNRPCQQAVASPIPAQLGLNA